MEKLGEDLLEKIMTEENDMLSSSQYETASEYDGLYLHTLNLSNFLSKNNTKMKGPSNLDNTKIKNINKLTQIIVDDLIDASKGPTIEVGPGPKILQAYKVLSYALLAIVNNTESSKNDDQIIKLEEKNAELQNMFDSLLSSSGDGQVYNERIASLEKSNALLEAERFEMQDKISELQEQVTQLKHVQKKSQKLVELLNTSLDMCCTIDDAYKLVGNVLHTRFLDNSKTTNYSINLSSDNDTFTQSCQQYTQFEADLVEAQNIIQTYKSENCALKQTIKMLEKEKEMIQSEFTESTKSNQQNENSQAKIFMLDTDLQISKIKCNELQEEIQRKKQKCQNLQNQISQNEEEIKKKNITISDLQMKLDDMQLRLDSKDTPMNIENSQNLLQKELKSKENQIQKLSSAITEIADQLEQVYNDLRAETQIKNTLIYLLQKQNNLMNVTEEIVSELQKKVYEYNKLTEALNEETKSSKELASCSHTEIITNLFQHIVSEITQTPITDHVQVLLCQETQSVQMKINNVIDFLINLATNSNLSESKQNNHEIDDRNELTNRLSIYIMNLVRFIDQLANSGEIQEWLLDSTQPADFRPRIIACVARIEAFLRQNHFDISTSELCDSFAHFPMFLEDKIDFAQTSMPYEYVAVIEQFTLANRLITKFSEELQRRGQLVVNDMREMREEMKRVEAEQRDQFDEETKHLSTRIGELEELTNRQQSIIDGVTKALRTSEDGGEGTSKALAILGSSSLSESNDYDEEEYIRKLESKIAELAQQLAESDFNFQEILDQVKEKHRSKKSKIYESLELLQKQNEELQEEINNQKEKLESLDRLNKENEDLKKENMELQTSLNMKMADVEKYQLSHEQEIVTLRDELETKAAEDISALNEKIDKLKEQRAEAEHKLQEELKAQRTAAKEELKKAKEDALLHAARANDIREHCEGVISELRAKLSEARKEENCAKEELRKISSDLKEAKASLSSARIDHKMLSMKLSSTEEKANREKALLETQIKIKLLSAETKAAALLEQTKAEHERQFQAFLVSVCDLFKDYVDFSTSISKESVLGLLKKVGQSNIEQFERINDLERSLRDTEKIRKLLKLKDYMPLYDSVSEVYNNLNELKGLKEQLEKEREDNRRIEQQNKAATMGVSSWKEWEEWGRRLHSIITDSFGNRNSEREVRFALEEALMAGMGQRRVWRRMEILRTEKKLLNSGIIQKTKQRSNKSVTSLLLVAVAVLRMEKLSGNLRVSVSIPKCDKAPIKITSKAPSETESAKTWPIIL